jgi:hypothetical protein
VKFTFVVTQALGVSWGVPLRFELICAIVHPLKPDLLKRHFGMGIFWSRLSISTWPDGSDPPLKITSAKSAQPGIGETLAIA